jgi:hypothetical protein
MLFYFQIALLNTFGLLFKFIEAANESVPIGSFNAINGLLLVFARFTSSS